MSWNFSRVLVEEFLAQGFLGIEQCAQLKSIRTAGKSSFAARKRVTWNPFLSGTTSERSTATHGVAAWISSLADSRVNRGVSPGNRKGKPTTETYGLTPSESFAKWDHASASWKTSQGSPANLTSGKKSCQTLRKLGLMCGGKLFLLPKSEPLTYEKDCGYTPTPTVGDSKSARNSTAKRNKIPPTGIHAGNTLTDYVTMFPTPTAAMYGTNQGGGSGRTGSIRPSLTTLAKKNLWPTPPSRDWKDGKNPKEYGRHSPALGVKVGGQLNPLWVAWLMGWPIGWTALEPLATDKFQQWLEKHGNG